MSGCDLVVLIDDALTDAEALGVDKDRQIGDPHTARHARQSRAALIEAINIHLRQAACSRMGIMDPDGGRTLPDELWRPTTAEPSVTILRDPPMATLKRMVKATAGDVDIRIARQMYEAITAGEKS